MRHIALLCVVLGLGTVIRAAEPKLVATLKGHKEYVSGIAFYPDSKMLVSASGDGTVRLWDVAAGKEREVLFKQKCGGSRNLRRPPR